MKILATGDWHIGKVSHGYGRAVEHRHFLNWLKERAVETKADILLVTGDVFDSKDPTPLSQEIYYDFLDDVSHACPGLRIVVIAGNHDNPTLLEAPKSILKRLRVDVRGTADGCDAADQSESGLLIPVEKDGERVWIIAVPYLRRSDFRFDQTYEQSVADFLSALVRAANGKREEGEPIVMMAHLYASGSLKSNDDDHSETIYVGGEPEIKMSTLTDRPDFLVSGHIHKRMNINDVPWAQYTGSALPMSFTETDYEHGADLLTFEEGKDMGHEFLKYDPLYKFISIGPASPEKIVRKIEEEWPRLNDKMFIQTRVSLEKAEPEMKNKLETIVKGIGAHFVYQPEIKEKTDIGGENSSISKPEDLSSDEIVREVILRRFASANDRDADSMDEEEKKLLEDILTKARSGNEE